MPDYYDGWRVGEFIEAMGLDFNEGNVVKYVSRWRRKDGLEDLRKCRSYIDRLIHLATSAEDGYGDEHTVHRERLLRLAKEYDDANDRNCARPRCGHPRSDHKRAPSFACEALTSEGTHCHCPMYTTQWTEPTLTPPSVDVQPGTIYQWDGIRWIEIGEGAIEADGVLSVKRRESYGESYGYLPQDQVARACIQAEQAHSSPPRHEHACGAECEGEQPCNSAYKVVVPITRLSSPEVPVIDQSVREAYQAAREETDREADDGMKPSPRPREHAKQDQKQDEEQRDQKPSQEHASVHASTIAEQWCPACDAARGEPHWPSCAQPTLDELEAES